MTKVRYYGNIRAVAQTTEDLLTVPKAAKELGKAKMTLYRWLDSGKLIAIKVGGILFIPKSEIERLNREENE